MVSCKLRGGLGNYMFQIATTISLAIDNKDKYEFYIIGTTKVHQHIITYMGSIFSDVNILDTSPKQYNVYHEPEFSYNKIPYQNDLLLCGYFQSEKYFKHNQNEIIDLFSPTHNELVYIYGKYGNKLSKDNSCSIHVRRGDYLKLKEHHPPCDMDYYNSAMNIMPTDTNYLIFSDDIEWCKKKFIGNRFTFIEDESDVIDLHTMSQCKHNIIANSSFSWWGAWLNNNKHSIIVAPTKWFGSAKGKINVDDVYADKWIKI